MKKTGFLFILLFLPLLCPAPELNQGYIMSYTAIKTQDEVLNAIIDYESKNNPFAFNEQENAGGILQITPIAIQEVNRILNILGSAKSYSLGDRWDPNKSKEIYYITQKFHNPSYDPELAARFWNGGSIKYRRSTDQYWLEIRKRL